MKSTLSVSRDLHPCFNPHAGKTHMRVHLPIAPKCNIQCNYCNRKYSCMNENRPGVTGNVLSPYQALYYLESLYAKNKEISVVGIAGPGDAMANPEETFTTLRLIRNKQIPVLFCLSTNGLKVEEYIDEIVDLDISHITITMNAVDPEIGQLIYGWVRDGVKIYRGKEAAELLMQRQLSAIKKLSDLGITVKINSILIPGINDKHIPFIAEKALSLGASIFNVMPLYPVADTAFEYIQAPEKEMVVEIQKKCLQIMPIMMHCQRCRSDAAGFLHEGIRPEFKTEFDKTARMPLNPYLKKDYIAVATTDCMRVNAHLGKAREMVIYSKDGDVFKKVAVRKMPQEGGGDERWLNMAKILDDCKAVVVSHVGKRPQEVLQKAGVKVYESNALLKDIIPIVFEGGEKIDQLFSPQGCQGPESYGFESNGCESQSACSSKGCNGCGGNK